MSNISLNIFLERYLFSPQEYSMRKKCLYPELFWSAFFSHFPTFVLSTERYRVRISVRMRENARKMRTKITPNTDTFYAVTYKEKNFKWNSSAYEKHECRHLGSWYIKWTFYKSFLNWNKIFKKEVVTGKSLFFAIGLSLTPHSIYLNVGFTQFCMENVAFSILVLSAKKRCSSFLK